MKNDFCLPAQGQYLLSHSVGRPLQSAQSNFNQQFMAPWQQEGREPWEIWLSSIHTFTQNLANCYIDFYDLLLISN